MIRRILAESGGLPRGYLGPGDDVALVPIGGKRLVAKVDMLVGRTDVPKKMTFRQAARKAVAMCVSDFASKGVRPDAFLVSLGRERKTTSRQVEEIGLGLADAAKEWRLKMVGGDTNESDDLVIDIAMFGFADGVVERRGARAGELVVTTGLYGFPPSGLGILIDGTAASPSFARKAVESVVHPTPDLEVGIALKRYLTSSMDSSDGLAICLYTLAESNGLGIELERLPVGHGVKGYAAANGLDYKRLVLAGGEEYLIVGTVKRQNLAAAERSVKKSGGSLVVIGRTNADSGRVSLKEDGKTAVIAREGWTHLSRR